MCSAKRMLCVALLIASAIATISADAGKFSSCCTRVTAVKPKAHIVDYIMQAADPPCLEAVIFFTEDKLLCTKPNLRWVLEKVKQISKLKEAKAKENAEKETSDN